MAGKKGARTIAKERDEKALSHKERFLISYKKWGFKGRALEESNLTLKTLKRWLEEDEAFAKSFDELTEELAELAKSDLEEVGMKRALSHSDGLLKFFLAHLDPSYRDRSEVEHKGAVGVVLKENLVLDDL